MSRLTPMIALVRASDGATILVPADMIGPVQELPGIARDDCHAPARSRVTLRDHTYFDVEEDVLEINQEYIDLCNGDSIVPVRGPDGQEDWAATRAAYGNRLHVDRWPAPTPEQIRERMTTSPGKDAE